MKVQRFKVGEIALQEVGFPGPDLDDCTILEYLGDGEYKIKFQVYGSGPWHEGIAKDRDGSFCGRLHKKVVFG